MTFLAGLFSGAGLTVLIIPFVPALPLWTGRKERPYECRHCRVDFQKAWQLDNHNSFHHPRPDIEDSRVEDRS